MKYAGIDPGKKGGIVLASSMGIEKLWRTPMLKGGKEYDLDSMASLVRLLKADGAFVVLEQCQPFARSGARKASYKSNFSSGHGYGLWIGLMAAVEVPYLIVHASRWRKKLSIKGDKAAALKAAQQLWPGADFVPKGCKVPHDGLIDAALLAEYGRRERG